MISKTNIQGAVVSAPNVLGAGDRPAIGTLELVHHVPGRLRLRSASLKGDARAGKEAGRRLAAIRGVTSVTANPCTGSLLLEYDTTVLPPRDIIGVLASHGYVPAAAKDCIDPGIDPWAGWADPLAGAVKDWVIGAVADRLALALIGALA